MQGCEFDAGVHQRLEKLGDKSIIVKKVCDIIILGHVPSVMPRGSCRLSNMNSTLAGLPPAHRWLLRLRHEQLRPVHRAAPDPLL
jgi:hypothetical protein